MAWLALSKGTILCNTNNIGLMFKNNDGDWGLILSGDNQVFEIEEQDAKNICRYIDYPFHKLIKTHTEDRDLGQP